MNKDAQRIAIAEACGWKVENYGPKGYEKLYWRLRRPDGTIREDDCTGEEWSRAVFGCMTPNYLNDLNAMHEALKTLDTLGEWMNFSFHLSCIVRELKYRPSGLVYDYMRDDSGKHRFDCVAATAAQFAEAFLRTIMKWDDSE